MSLSKILLTEDKCPTDISNDWSDGIRKGFIEDFLQNVKEDPQHNTEEPNHTELLDPDPWSGYEKQTYIQNDLKNDRFIFFEGFSDYCWEAFEEKYPNMSRKEIIEKFINTRGKKLGEDFGYKMIDSDFWYEEDIYGDSDYILKMIFKEV